jgi:hypothetical protein
MTGPPLTGLTLVRDQLAEARRYTHSDPEATTALLELAIGNLGLGLAKRKMPRLWIHRIRMNLIRGLRCMAAAPDVTDAAITLALWELGDLASRLRLADEAEGRDVELLEGYGPKGEG